MREPASGIKTIVEIPRLGMKRAAKLEPTAWPSWLAEPLRLSMRLDLLSVATLMPVII